MHDWCSENYQKSNNLLMMAWVLEIVKSLCVDV